MSTTAFLLVLSAAIFHASWNFVLKGIGGDMKALWLSTIVSTVCSFPLIFFFPGGHFSFQEIFLIVAVGAVHALYVFFLGKSYEHGDMSFVYPIARGLGVAGTAFFGYVFLKEPLSSFGILGLIGTVLGIFLMAKMGAFKSFDRAFFYALAVGAMIAIYSLIARSVVQVVHPVLYNFLIGLFQRIFLTPLVYLNGGKIEVKKTWQKFKSPILLIGVLSPLTYLIVLFALVLSPAGYVVATRETGIVFGAFLGAFFLHEKFTWRKGLGIVAMRLLPF